MFETRTSSVYPRRGRRRQLEEPLQQRRRDPAAPVRGRDRDVHHVPRVDVARDESGSRPAPSSSNAPSASELGFGELAGEHRARPRRRIRARARSARSRSRSRSSSRRSSTFTRDHRFGIGGADVDRLDALGRPELRRAAAWSARAARALVVVGRRRRAPVRSSVRAVAHGAVADAERARLELQIVRRRRTRGPGTKTSRRRASITGSAPGAAGGERVERRDAGDGDLEREREAARDARARCACS